MKRYYHILVILSLIMCPGFITYSQDKKFLIMPAPFSSRIFDEFSPVFFSEGIVFCSNQNDNSLVSYNYDQKRLFKIFYVTKKTNSSWSNPNLLAKEINCAFNNGPATFNKECTLMYFSRNNFIEYPLRNISDTSNKLGIYSSELKDGKWTNLKPFTYNNQKYSFCTPALSPGGDRLYFSSDMPGGSGGMDLYFCDLKNNNWMPPVNLGPLINTKGNETFPYVCRFNKIYFSSDGRKGFGMKDIYYSQEINGEWITPVHLDSGFNSPWDDFGIVIDSTLSRGFFSTNRRGTDDIYSFVQAPVEFSKCDTIKKNRNCFTFYDEKYSLLDTLKVLYNWDFGDGKIRMGREVSHCFPGPGKYSVMLNIIDQFTGDTIAKNVEYLFQLENYNQAVIASDNTGLKGKPISFSGILTDLKELKITDIFWNFGDGFNPGRQQATHVFGKAGEYQVKLGLISEKDSAGNVLKVCVMKKIKIN